MKKRIICLLAALLLLLGLSVSASAAVYANVIDTAELLSESEAEALDARCSELEQTYGCGVYLVTVDDYTAYYSADSIESFAESVFLDLGLGAGEEQDGVLLVLSMAERDYDICAHGTIGNRTFTDYGKGVLAERWSSSPSAGTTGPAALPPSSTAAKNTCAWTPRARPSTRAPTRSGWGIWPWSSGWS